MTTATLAITDIDLDKEGLMTNAAEWNEDIAQVIADSVGIQLTDEHWKLINFAREDFKKKKTSPGLRRISKYGKVGMKDIYRLFPKGPGKLIAKCAGLPKPKSCL